MSVFGSSDVPTTSRADPIATADTMAAWVTQYSLDGIDVDYEVSASRSTLFQFLTKTRRTLPLSTQATAKLK